MPAPPLPSRGLSAGLRKMQTWLSSSLRCLKWTELLKSISGTIWIVITRIAGGGRGGIRDEIPKEALSCPESGYAFFLGSSELHGIVLGSASHHSPHPCHVPISQASGPRSRRLILAITAFWRLRPTNDML